MEQKSNVQYRAEKEYKHSREKFFLLLREIISNAIHAVLIRQSKETNFAPKLDFNVELGDTSCKIELKDNGEGFTKNNRQCFEELDKKNQKKESFRFHPLGQGRLAIIYFTDSAKYETVYKDEEGKYMKQTIPYPPTDTSLQLFSCDAFSRSEDTSHIQDTYTKLIIGITANQTLGRAKTFFKKYPNVASLKQWFIETFFPFLISNEQLTINICFNGENAIVDKSHIEYETKTLPFGVKLSDGNKDFKLWLLKANVQMHGENAITCFARNLKADLTDGKLTYCIDNDKGYLLYLTSDYFDEYVDTTGEKIEIPCDDITKINEKINEVLDKEFQTIISRNQIETKRNLTKFQEKYPSLAQFVPQKDTTQEKCVIGESDILQSAIKEKGRIEKVFWNQVNHENTAEEEDNYSNSEDCSKLLNSSLHIYVQHRERILKRLHTLIQKFGQDGEYKPELESSVHELFINRGTILSNHANINHLHNLWILDDKFTTFSNDFKAKSTKSGEPLSDIYIWADIPNEPKQILILELKSTTKAHNAGNKQEGMIAQVKRYAQNFYKDPSSTLNWDVNTSTVQYIGIILARKSDINKELTSANTGGTYKPFPFLKDSFYIDDSFAVDINNPRNTIGIRIELYSFEDIYQLASNRNDVFFRLLKREFNIEESDE